MRPNGKGNHKKTSNVSLSHCIEKSAVDIEQQCPTLHKREFQALFYMNFNSSIQSFFSFFKVVESNDFNLLDLTRLQSDLERTLAATTQQMVCLSAASSSNATIPAPILRNLGLLPADPASRPTHPCEMDNVVAASTSSQSEKQQLVVTANPHKPLSLIISSSNPSTPTGTPRRKVEEPGDSSNVSS